MIYILGAIALILVFLGGLFDFLNGNGSSKIALRITVVIWVVIALIEASKNG